MPKTKVGEIISWKEFGKRWKKGIEGITPLQKQKTQLNGTNIQLIGILLGFTISIINYKQLWWVSIILFGATIVSGVQRLGLKQQIIALEKIEDLQEVNLNEILEGGKE